jgi:hypothetical protein
MRERDTHTQRLIERERENGVSDEIISGHDLDFTSTN